MMHDALGQTLYVGKAKNLKNESQVIFNHLETTYRPTKD